MRGLFAFVMCALATWQTTAAQGHEGEKHVLDTSKEGMQAIAKSLGVECTHCHVAKTADGKPDFKAPSKFKATALHMHEHFVQGLTAADGSALTCQTCHNGKARFVPRDVSLDPPVRLSSTMERQAMLNMMKEFTKALNVQCNFCHEKARDGRLDPTIPTRHRTMARFMFDHFTGMKTKSGEAVTCATCHNGKTEYLPRNEGE